MWYTAAAKEENKDLVHGTYPVKLLNLHSGLIGWVVYRIWCTGSGVQDLVYRIWCTGSGVQDLVSGSSVMLFG
jgi:hypothetical protein